MRIVVLGIAIAATSCLAACSQEGGAITRTHGRFEGVGVYSPGVNWAGLKTARGPQPADVASLADDEHIIVVVDSRTGEIRQCGDLSGFCVSQNPWTKGPKDLLAGPVTLTRPQVETATTHGAITLQSEAAPTSGSGSRP